jgi:hypothetical protein
MPQVTFSFATNGAEQGNNNMVSRTKGVLEANGIDVHMKNENVAGEDWEDVWLSYVRGSCLAVCFLDAKYKAGGTKSQKHPAGACKWEYGQLMNGTNTGGVKVIQISYEGKTAQELAQIIVNKM